MIENITENSKITFDVWKGRVFSSLFKFRYLLLVKNMIMEPLWSKTLSILKVALYFAFMGFYTNWLIAFSIIGVVVFIYGVATFSSSIYVNEMCETDLIMCPTCDLRCNYWSVTILVKLFKNNFDLSCINSDHYL